MSCQSQRSRTNLQRGYFLFFSFFKAKIFTVATMLSAIKSVISIFWNKFGILGLQESLITLVWSHFIFYFLFFFCSSCAGERCNAVWLWNDVKKCSVDFETSDLQLAWGWVKKKNKTKQLNFCFGVNLPLKIKIALHLTFQRHEDDWVTTECSSFDLTVPLSVIVSCELICTLHYTYYSLLHNDTTTLIFTIIYYIVQYTVLYNAVLYQTISSVRYRGSGPISFHSPALFGPAHWL